MRIFALLILVLAGCGKQSEAPAGGGPGGPPPVTVTTATVEQGAIAESANFVGTIRWGRRVTLQTLLSGTLIDTALSPGSSFSKGDILAQVDPTDYELAIKEAEAALAQANARLAELQAGTRPEIIKQLSAAVDRENALLTGAADRLERAIVLAEKKVRTEADVVAARAESQAAQARLADMTAKLEEGQHGETLEAIAVGAAAVAVAETMLAQAQRQHSKCELKAPFDGVILERNRQAGDRVQAGESLASLAAGPLEAWVEVPEQLVYAMPEPGTAVSVSSGAARGRNFEATVAALIPVADSATRNATLRLILTGDAKGVAEGMSVQAKLEVGAKTDALLVPLDAVSFGRHGASVQVVGPGNKIAIVPITVGLRTPQIVEIIGEIAAGAVVVTTGNEVLYPGAVVQVAP
ncbi:MAG: HlyD family secretion protein [Rhodothermales bacterium]|jgi:HlyD family secretion protein